MPESSQSQEISPHSQHNHKRKQNRSRKKHQNNNKRRSKKNTDNQQSTESSNAESSPPNRVVSPSTTDTSDSSRHNSQTQNPVIRAKSPLKIDTDVTASKTDLDQFASCTSGAATPVTIVGNQSSDGTLNGEVVENTENPITQNASTPKSRLTSQDFYSSSTSLQKINVEVIQINQIEEEDDHIFHHSSINCPILTSSRDYLDEDATPRPHKRHLSNVSNQSCSTRSITSEILSIEGQIRAERHREDIEKSEKLRDTARSLSTSSNSSTSSTSKSSDLSATFIQDITHQNIPFNSPKIDRLTTKINESSNEDLRISPHHKSHESILQIVKEDVVESQTLVEQIENNVEREIKVKETEIQQEIEPVNILQKVHDHEDQNRKVKTQEEKPQLIFQENNNSPTSATRTENNNRDKKFETLFEIDTMQDITTNNKTPESPRLQAIKDLCRNLSEIKNNPDYSSNKSIFDTTRDENNNYPSPGKSSRPKSQMSEVNSIPSNSPLPNFKKYNERLQYGRSKSNMNKSDLIDKYQTTHDPVDNPDKEVHPITIASSRFGFSNPDLLELDTSTYSYQNSPTRMPKVDHNNNSELLNNTIKLVSPTIDPSLFDDQPAARNLPKLAPNPLKSKNPFNQDETLGTPPKSPRKARLNDMPSTNLPIPTPRSRTSSLDMLEMRSPENLVSPGEFTSEEVLEKDPVPTLPPAPKPRSRSQSIERLEKNRKNAEKYNVILPESNSPKPKKLPKPTFKLPSENKSSPKNNIEKESKTLPTNHPNTLPTQKPNKSKAPSITSTTAPSVYDEWAHVYKKKFAENNKKTKSLIESGQINKRQLPIINKQMAMAATTYIEDANQSFIDVNKSQEHFYCGKYPFCEKQILEFTAANSNLFNKDRLHQL